MNTTERFFALREAHQNEAVDAYFAARPSRDLPLARESFEAGFVRAFGLLSAPRIDALLNLTAPEWDAVARACAGTFLGAALIARAQLTPYEHINGYMSRWWLFNRFDLPGGAPFPELPSARVHHILRRDLDPHPHNHPWDARTVILKGWYREERDDGVRLRGEGDTFEIKADTFHRIVEVSPGGEAYQSTASRRFLVKFA